MMMKSICGWCGRVKDPGTGEKNEIVTHGICGVCRKSLKEEGKMEGSVGVTLAERDALLSFDYEEPA